MNMYNKKFFANDAERDQFNKSKKEMWAKQRELTRQAKAELHKMVVADTRELASLIPTELDKATAKAYMDVIDAVFDQAIFGLRDSDLIDAIEAMKPTKPEDVYVSYLNAESKARKDAKRTSTTNTTTTTTTTTTKKTVKAQPKTATQKTTTQKTKEMTDAQAEAWLARQCHKKMAFNKITDKGTYLRVDAYHSVTDQGVQRLYQTKGWMDIVGSNPTYPRVVQYDKAQYKITIGNINYSGAMYLEWDAKYKSVTHIASLLEINALQAMKKVAKNSKTGTEIIIFCHTYDSYTLAPAVREMLKHGAKVTITMEDKGVSYDTLQLLDSNENPIDLGTFSVQRKLVINYTKATRIEAIKTARKAIEKRDQLQLIANEKLDILVQKIETDAKSFRKSTTFERASIASALNVDTAMQELHKATGLFLEYNGWKVRDTISVQVEMMNYIKEHGEKYGIETGYMDDDFYKMVNRYGITRAFRDYHSTLTCTSYLGKDLKKIKDEARPGYAGNPVEYKPNKHYTDEHLNESRVAKQAKYRLAGEAMLVDLIKEFTQTWVYVNGVAKELYMENYTVCPQCGHVHKILSIASADLDIKEQNVQVPGADGKPYYIDIIARHCPKCNYETVEERAAGLEYKAEADEWMKQNNYIGANMDCIGR